MARITDDYLREMTGNAIAYSEIDWRKILHTPAITVFHCGGSVWITRADGRTVKISVSVL